MRDVSGLSRIIKEYHEDNINPLEMTFSSVGCTFKIVYDDIAKYFRECPTGSFKQIIK